MATTSLSSSGRKRGIALILDIFLGVLGVHRFYVGKWGTGLIWLFTAGIGGIGVVVDAILLLLGTFTDKEGRELRQWM